MGNDIALFYVFCERLAKNILDEYFSVMSVDNHTTQEIAKDFVVFNAVLQREFIKRMSIFDHNAEEIYKKELERFGKIFEEQEMFIEEVRDVY